MKDLKICASRSINIFYWHDSKMALYLSPCNGTQARVMVYYVYFITYLLLTEFKGRTESNGPRFFFIDL